VGALPSCDTTLSRQREDPKLAGTYTLNIRAQGLIPWGTCSNAKEWEAIYRQGWLTNRKVKTPRGGNWHPQTVKMVMQRLASAT